MGIRDQPSGALSRSIRHMFFFFFLVRSCASLPITTNHSPEVQDLPELTSSARTSNCDAAFVCSTQLRTVAQGRVEFSKEVMMRSEDTGSEMIENKNKKNTFIPEV